MKTIGLLGGTGWQSTLKYYELLNTLIYQKKGGYHSANIILKSIDYHEIVTHYGVDDAYVTDLLRNELNHLISLKPDSVIICCNTLHKYFDLIKDYLDLKIPVFHGINLVANGLKSKGYNRVLLLATKFTLDDGFFARTLEQQGIKVTLPTPEQRIYIRDINQELCQSSINPKSMLFFKDLIAHHKNLDAVVLGCTEFQLLINQEESVLPIMDPMVFQAQAAVDHYLD